MLFRALVLLSVMCVIAVSVSGFAITTNDHGHNYNCTGGGIYTDPADQCKGFHVCGYNIFTNTYEHKFYLECFGNQLYNGRLCVSPQLYTCPN